MYSVRVYCLEIDVMDIIFRPVASAGVMQRILLICIVFGVLYSCGAFSNHVAAAPVPGIADGLGVNVDPTMMDSHPALAPHPDVPVANFTAKKGAVTRFSVFFDGSSSLGSNLNYQWSFDDESTLTSATPVKFYKGPYVGLVTLKVSNPAGSDSITKRLRIGSSGDVTLESYDLPGEIQETVPAGIANQIPHDGTAGSVTTEPADYLQKFVEGSQYLGEGDFAAAIESYNESIRLNSSFPEAYLGRGIAYFQEGYFNFYELRGKEELLQAIDDFSLVLQDDPKNTEALIGRGAAFVYLGDYYSWRSYIDNETVFRYYEAALRDFNTVIKTSPDSIDGLNGKAYASLMLGSGNPARKVNSALVDAAKQDAEQSLLLNSTNPRAHFVLGLYYDNEGYYVAAIEEFTKAIEQDPYEAWYYEWRGYEKFLKGDYSDAIEDYNAALALQPRFADTYSMRGVARTYLMNTNDRSPELSDFNQAIEISPDISEFQRYYALVLASWKYWDKSLNEHAVDVLSRASALDPSDYRIYGDKASLLTVLNRNHEATEQLIRYQRESLTNEEKMMANDLLAYNNVEPWYSNSWG